ncbi:MAG: hypothetical protein ABMA15_21410 [Vicinamibacterales bacterium]
MTTKTRYFVVGSLLTVGVGLGIGAVAYSTGFATSAYTLQGGPAELQFVPANASLVAYADVHDLMLSDLRQRVHRLAFPGKLDGQSDFQNQTGINIETDIDHVIAALVPSTGDQVGHTSGTGIVLARGRFDQVKIEALMREHGAQAEDYKGSRLIVGDIPAGRTDGRTDGRTSVSVAFLEPGLVAVGSSALVRSAVDQKTGGASIATNDEMMGLIRDLGTGNAWAAGRFDALTSHAHLPDGVAEQIPSIHLFSASAHIDSGVRGLIRAQTRDDESANSLRDVVRGFLALARLQTSANPEISNLVQSLQLGGTGKSVSLSFDVPGAALDALQSLDKRGDRSSSAPRQ